MKIKQGDMVVVKTGSRNDQGKKGKVLTVFKNENKVVVEGVNLKKKVARDGQGKKSIVEVEFPVDASNVMFFDEKAKKASRIGYTKDAKGNKVRVAKASGTELK